MYYRSVERKAFVHIILDWAEILQWPHTVNNYIILKS